VGDYVRKSYQSCQIRFVTPKHSDNGSEWAITSRNKMSNDFETVKDTRNKSIDHDYETRVSLSDSVRKICVKRRLAE